MWKINCFVYKDENQDKESGWFLLICFETNNPKWYDFKIVMDTTNYVLRKAWLQYPVEAMLTQITVLIYTK